MIQSSKKLGLAHAFIGAGLTVFAFGKTQAQGFIFEDGFNLSADKFKTVHLTPVRQMDDETLFLSAEARRESDISSERRIINCRWLTQNRANTPSGGAAFSKYIRMNLATYLRSQRASRQLEQDDEVQQTQRSELAKIENYDLRLSNDKIMLSFQYRF